MDVLSLVVFLKVEHLPSVIVSYCKTCQEAIEHLETELDREIEERKRAEKRMRSAESAVIEIKNDDIMARDSRVLFLHFI